MTTSEARRYQNLRAHLGYLKLNDAADALNTVLDAARSERLSLTAALERLLETTLERPRTNPCDGAEHPAAIRNSVDFPDPFTPNTTDTEPGDTARLTPDSTSPTPR